MPSELAAIAAPSGIDAIYVGPWDLGLSLEANEPGDLTDKVIEAAVHQVRAACRQADLPWGVHTTNLGAAQLAHNWGASLINVAADQTVLNENASAIGDVTRQIRDAKAGPAGAWINS
jgi:4-hydroxy-2-oxoheptanedioate aldolase